MSVKGIAKQVAAYQGLDKAAANVSSTGQVPNINTNSTQKTVTVELENGSADSGQQKERNPELTQITNAINDVNVKLKPTRTGCEFTYHEKVHRVSIKIINKDTKEIIKEIPPEETYKALEKIWEIAGLLVDERR